MTKILITGAAGFLGRHLFAAIEDRPWAMTLVDPAFTHVSTAKGNVRLIRGTFQEYLSAFPLGAPPKYDIIVHLAAGLTKKNIAQRNSGGMDLFDDIATDMHMAKFIEHTQPGRVVWLSSCAVDAQETENYSFCKYVGERFARTLAKQGMPIVILRPYGGYSHTQAPEYPFPSILGRAQRREDPLVVWGSTATTRDWIHVDDLTRAIVHAVDGGFPVGMPMPICTGVPTTFGELAQMMAEQVGYDPKIVADEGKPVGSSFRVGDPQVASMFGFEAKVTLEEGIRRGIQQG